MQLTSVLNSGHLYAVDQAFPKEIADLVDTYDWLSADYTRISIGRNRRRLLTYNVKRDMVFDHWARNKILPEVERVCGITFTDNSQYCFDWWLDEPGFKPAMHTDGDKPGAMQIYWLPTDRNDLGTAFYSTSDTKDLTYYFANLPNTGYMMLNAHDPRPMLWHDMQKEVPENCVRLSLYLSFGPYR